MNRIAELSTAVVLAAALSAPALAAPQTYTIDDSHTFPSFSYSHFGLSFQVSRFNHTSGTVILDKAARTGAVDITIDMKSVDTGSTTFDEHIQEADFFDTATYPTATFKSTKVNFDGDQPASVEGDLTIKGITKPVTLEVTHFTNMLHPMLNKDAIGANARVVVKRSEFNAGKYAPQVGDDVTISISIEAVAQ